MVRLAGYLFGRSEDRESLPPLRAATRVAILALSVRLIAFIAVSAFLAVTDRRFLFPDEVLYMSGATQVAHDQGFTIFGYANFLGVVFDLTGVHYWLARLINVVVGSAVAVAVWGLVRAHLGDRAAMFGGLAAALWPSLVLWSVVALKDSFVLVGVGLALIGAARLPRSPLPALVSLIAGASLLLVMRPYLYVVVTIAVVLGAALSAVIERSKATAWLGGAAVAVGFVGLVGGVGPFGVDFVRVNASVATVEGTHSGPVGDTQFVGDPPDTLGEVATSTPKGLFYSLLGPFPWNTGETAAIGLIVVELPVWYAALVLGAMGLWRLGVRAIMREWSVSVLYALGVVIILGIFQANAGTALRERIVILPVIITAACVNLRAGRASQALVE